MVENAYAGEIAYAGEHTLLPGAARLQTEHQINFVMVVIRVAMGVFPFLTILPSYDRFRTPWAELVGLGIVLGQCLLLVVWLRRGGSTRRTVVVRADLLATALAVLVCTLGAGTAARQVDLNGLLPYLLALAGVYASSQGPTLESLVVLAALVVGWQFVPVGHDLVPRLSDIFGLVFWGALGCFVTVALRRMAGRVDAQHEHFVELERREVERWLHDDLINIVGRVARGEELSAADRARAARLEVGARLRIADVRVVAPGVEGLLEAAAVAAEQTGVGLIVETSVTAVPDCPSVLRALSLALPCLIDNAKRHGGAERIRLALLANRERLVLTLSHQGHGYDPQAVAWSPHTRRTVFEALADVGAIAIPERPLDDVGGRWRLQWPA